METIEVSEEQYAYIEHLREQLERRVVGRYGHVREQDVIQYLIDNLDVDPSVGELEPASAGTSEGLDSEESLAGEQTVVIGTDGSTETLATESGAASDDDKLAEMMNLLETHAEKWGEATTSDYRYSVTLPDGTVENVSTKDDVRALLFKNYR